MTEALLKTRLDPVVRRRSRLRFRWRLAAGWGAAAILAVLVLAAQSALGWASTVSLPLVALAGLVTALVIAWRGHRTFSNLRSAAEAVERGFPELDGLVLTAVQQEERADAPLSYLQRCLLRDAVSHSRTHDWPAVVPSADLNRAGFAQLATFALFLGALWFLRTPGDPLHSPLMVRTSGVSVTPGDASIERGESLVVLARFGSTPPASAELVIGGSAATERRMPLTRSLSDPIFGGSVPNVTQDFIYRVEYARTRTRDFKVTVFEHPRLERADAELAYPEYTKQAPRRVEDTRRITAVEGTRLHLALQLNKQVASAVLTPRGQDVPAIPLAAATNRAGADLVDYTLLRRGTYELQLRDADGRTNKTPVQFVFEVLTNRTPELKLASPRGDVRPSALEEVRFEGTVWDDFGVLAHGLGFTVAGQETRLIELGRAVPAGERRSFQHVLNLEDLRVEPDQLVSWYLWADDIGPDGQVRHTTGDLLFAEIRPFEETFREGSGNEEEQSAEQQDAQGNRTQQLLRLQKQIVSATWKLQRDSKAVTEAYKKDVGVVRESQEQASEQAESFADRAGDPRARGLWDAVLEDMGHAVVRLEEAEGALAGLAPSLEAEQAAYQGLLKLQTRQTEVSRSRSRGQGQAGEAANQRQLDQLELTQADSRYETQRQAQAPVTPERREQLQVLNRLQELARRQQDLNDRLKELQTALQEADTEVQREELRRQLKRLQDEQRQMLADLDELNQRTQRPENQARMSELRQRLDQTRNEMQRASEAAGQGAVSQALASGSRAQRDLQDMRDDLRKQNSSQFAEDLRDMRADARELERRQQEISRDLATSEKPQRPSLGSTDKPQDLGERLGDQKQRLTNLVDRATQLSQAAEASEPLVSDGLYETLRQLSQDEARSVSQMQDELLQRGRLTRSLYERLRATAADDRAKSLEVTSEMLRQGLEAEAGEANQRASANIELLRRGVEKAAERVLGDDTSALRLARDELQALSEQLEREINGATGAPRSESSTNLAGNPQQSGAGQDGQRKPDSDRQPGEGRDPGAKGSEDTAQAGAGQRDGAPSDASNGAQANPGESREGNEQQQASSGQSGAGRNGRGNRGGQPGGQRANGGQDSAPNDAPRDLAQNSTAEPGAGTQGQGGGRGARGERGQRGQPGQRGERGGQGNPAGGPGGRNNQLDLNQFLGGPQGTGDGWWGGTGPITTEGFAPWSDRLREVEELIDLPDLRNEVAMARERARLTRLELRRDLKKPDWAVVRLQVLSPLVEVRKELDAELARRTSEDPLLPIDRDPVPTRFSELVRRYYEELGKDR